MTVIRERRNALTCTSEVVSHAVTNSVTLLFQPASMNASELEYNFVHATACKEGKYFVMSPGKIIGYLQF